MPLEFAVMPELDWVPDERQQNEMMLDIGDTETWRAINSPYRMRLFEMIRRSDGLTINELAQATDTIPVNLYYHIRTLEAHKLIKPSGYREGVARRAPVIYIAATPELKIQYNPNSKTHQERLSTLRRTWIREAETSLEQSSPCTSDETPSLFRWELLTEEQHQEIRRHMDHVAMILEDSRTANPAENSPRRLHYVGFQIAEVPEDTLPAPRIMLREEETMRDRTNRSNLELIESKMQA